MLKKKNRITKKLTFPLLKNIPPEKKDWTQAMLPHIEATLVIQIIRIYKNTWSDHSAASSYTTVLTLELADNNLG